MDYYVYCHNKISDGKCFYFGHGKDSQHRGRGKKNQDWIDIAEKEGGVSWRILVSGLTKKQACKIEQSFIRQIGHENLANRKSGPKDQTGKKRGPYKTKKNEFKRNIEGTV